MELKVGIIGSRTFRNYDLLKTTILENNILESITHIVSGGAVGADSLAEDFADEFSKIKLIFKPDWNKLGLCAGFVRNTEIVENSDMFFIFWDGKSKGTKDSINKIKMSGKPYKIILFS